MFYFYCFQNKTAASRLAAVCSFIRTYSRHIKYPAAYIFLLLFLPAGVYVQEQSIPQAEILLAGYLEQDIELHRLAAQLENTLLAEQKTRLQQGFSIQLKTGDMVLYKKDGALGFGIKPSVSMSVPVYNGIDITLSSPYKNENGRHIFEDVSAKIGAGLWGNLGRKRNVLLLQAERSVLEAERAVRSQSRNAEMNFYTELKTLYSAAAAVMNARDELFADEIEFETVKVQGYGESSAKYRLAELQVATSQQKVQSLENEYNQKYTLFFIKCGIDPPPFPSAYPAGSNTTLAPLPQALPAANTENLYSFLDQAKKEHFVRMEAAVWNRFIGDMERRAAEDFSLGANAGFTWNNTNTANTGTADMGLSFSWRGITASAGVSVPVANKNGSNITPAFTFSAGWTPTVTRIGNIEKKQRDIDARLDGLTIDEAEQYYRETMTTMRQSIDDLVKQQKQDREQTVLNEQLARDTEEWYRKGVITETEYRKATTNLETARLRNLSTDADLIIAELKLKLLFIEDDME